MMSPHRKILFLDPVFKDNIWGGTRLRTDFGYSVEGAHIGECWAVAAHPGGDNAVHAFPDGDGVLTGKTLRTLYKENPELFGNPESAEFPLLVKIIDAKEDLSVQVHPDDEYAAAHENGAFGKTECWYVLDAPEDGALVIGTNAGNKEELRDMVENGRFQKLIREVPVRKGDFIQIDPGTVHAIHGGFLILETQQNSDITYRLYDYGRLDSGKPRALHLKESMDVIRVPGKDPEACVIRKDAIEAKLRDNALTLLYGCPYYRVFELRVNGKTSFSQDFPFLNMSVIEGRGTVRLSEDPAPWEGKVLEGGMHFILPSGFGTVELQGHMRIVCSTTGGN